MNIKPIKVGVSLLILALPAFVFLFLKGFGENKFDLPIMTPESGECPKANVIDGVHRVPPFQLVSQEGKTISEADFKGKVYVAEFFFSRCPDICPVMSSELARVQATFKDRQDLKILSFSVDPAHDSVEVLREYASRYQANPNFWTFATGDKKAIYDLARCGYFIAARENSTQGSVDFVHSDKLTLVDKEGRIRGYYSGTERREVDRLITEIQVLLKTYE